MRFNLIGSFAAGVLISTSIISAVYVSGKGVAAKKPATTTANQAQTATKLSENEMKIKLEDAGYVVQTKAEYDKNMENAKVATQKQTTAVNKKPQKVVYRAVVKVTKGMTSIDVGRQLVRARIISNAFKFSKDVERKGIENNLRPGTYVVDSSMPYNKIISSIFKK